MNCDFYLVGGFGSGTVCGGENCAVVSGLAVKVFCYQAIGLFSISEVPRKTYACASCSVEFTRFSEGGQRLGRQLQLGHFLVWELGRRRVLLQENRVVSSRLCSCSKEAVKGRVYLVSVGIRDAPLEDLDAVLHVGK